MLEQTIRPPQANRGSIIYEGLAAVFSTLRELTRHLESTHCRSNNVSWKVMVLPQTLGYIDCLRVWRVMFEKVQSHVIRQVQTYLRGVSFLYLQTSIWARNILMTFMIEAFFYFNMYLIE